ncbi:CBF/Mak21 family-domain-containing protein [Leucosporidium creatinivorum]|uniref:CBF/Mak21 family-domain-containing protein n=1 Tax=Leucosporidium creatinivorum TaxID=106004 RepID=A0A1Y2G4Q3_9BASI|nr:CBF/Mak21 family-domain-containing protein [Leucosporidium creatinivorum]
MAPNPYIKAVTGSNGPKPKKEKGAKKSVQFDGAVSSPKGKEKDTSQQELLRNEILALGGDEEDLKLLRDVDSDSEVEGDAEEEPKKKGKGSSDKVDPALSKDLRSLFKSLDFASAGGAALAASDEEDEAIIEDDDEEDDDEEDSEDSEEEEEEEEVAPAPVAKPAKEEQKESKHDREERRKVERELEKAKLAAEKAVVREERATVKLPVVKSPWIVDPTPQWYAIPTPRPSSAPRPSAALAGTLAAKGESLLAKENALYATSLAPATRGSAAPPANGLSKADQVFIQQILTSGTSSDKVSALLLLVSSSPLHTMSYLEQLAALAKKKSRDESGRAVRGVVEWWRGDGGEGGGAPSRKLRAFADQPGLGAVAQAWEGLEAFGKGREQKAANAGMTREELERTLVVYAFEDWLKKWFFTVLQALEQMSVDPLPHPRTLAVVHLSNLLRDKPEQEGNILRLLVNKLGDSNRNIASKTSHHLLQILQFHPGMTPIMVREVSSLILRPTAAPAPAASSGSHVRFDKKEAPKDIKPKAKDNGQDHARYYGVITLNQVMLKKEQTEVAGKMIEVYFEIFGDILGRVVDEGEKAEKEENEDGAEEKKKGEKRKRGEKGGKKGGKDAEKAEGEVSETDSKLVAAVLTGVNRAFPFATIEEEAFKKRLDTLFRITHTGTFNVSIQALMLIYHVSAAKRAVTDRFHRALYASLFDPRLAGSSKQALYLNLVFKAMKADTDKKRVMALLKRLVQVMLGMDVTFILGSIWIVGELMSTIPGLRNMLNEPENLVEKAAAAKAKAAEAATDGASSSKLESVAYDGRKREPQFANAQNSCLWELTPLLHHWHPSVALHADQLLTGEPISASADLEQHSLNHFLDRFVYREAKKNVSTKGSSMMQSGVAGQDRTGRVVMQKGGVKGDEVVVNSENFLKKNEWDVPVDQLFFHKYFKSKTTLGDDKAKASKKRKSRNDEDEEESEAESIDDNFGEGAEDFDGLAEAMADDDDEPEEVEEGGETDSEAEEEIWQAMKRSMPKARGDSDGEVDEDSEVEEDDEDLAAYDYSDSEDGEGEGGADDVPFKSAFPDEDDIDDDDNAFLEDEDDLLGSDEDMPMFLDGDKDDEDEDDGKKKKGKGKNADRKAKKRKLNSMPTFATAEDYAHLLGDSDDDDV